MCQRSNNCCRAEDHRLQCRHSPRDDCLGREREYTLEFHNFTAKEIARIENFLVIFRCYGEHRPTEQRPTYVRYSYYSSISVAKLGANLNRLLRDMEEADGFVTTLVMSGTEFAATKIRPRR